MKQEKGKNEKELQSFNPKNRDFQRTEDDIDNVSDSERKSKGQESGLSQINPKDRDFQRGSNKDE